MSKATEIKTKAPWDETIRTIIYAIILAIVFRSFFFEPFHIPSGSMKSNLLVGDYLFVSKYKYGYSRFSFPLGIPFFEGRIWADRPKRGDVIVFRLPRDPRVDYIKRVIGLPGDRIQVKRGTLFLNGEEIPRKYIDMFQDDEGGVFKDIPRYEETLPEGRQITILKEQRMWGDANNTGEYIVPEGQYFFMGDNRDNSRDSRFLLEVGYVPFENIVGRAEIIFFSTDGSAALWEPWKWFQAMRYSRFFKVID